MRPILARNVRFQRGHVRVEGWVGGREELSLPLRFTDASPFEICNAVPDCRAPAGTTLGIGLPGLWVQTTALQTGLQGVLVSLPLATA